MKILVVVPYFYPKLGGVEIHTYNLYKNLAKKYNWQIVIVTSNHENKKYKEEILQNMKVYRLPYLFKVSNTPINPFWLFTLKKIIKKENPDAVSAHTPVPFIADIAALVSGDIPFILKYHSGSMKKNIFPIDILIYMYEKIFLKFLLHRANSIIATSDFVKLNFLKRYHEKSVTISPAVDAKLYKPGGNKTERNTVLYIGRIEKSSKWKGINYLLDAVKIAKETLPDIKLILVGDGDDVGCYKEYARQLSIEKNIKFLGALDTKKTVKIIQQTSLLALPSVTDAESFGNVLIEAMACAKPVIGFNIGGIPSVIDNYKNGILVPVKNIYALSQAIVKIVSDPILAKKLGENGRRKVINNYSQEKQLELTKDVIEKVYKVYGRK